MLSKKRLEEIRARRMAMAIGTDQQRLAARARFETHAADDVSALLFEVTRLRDAVTRAKGAAAIRRNFKIASDAAKPAGSTDTPSGVSDIFLAIEEAREAGRSPHGD